MKRTNDVILLVFGAIVIVLAQLGVALASPRIAHPWIVAAVLLGLAAVECGLVWTSAILQRPSISRWLHVGLLTSAVLLCAVLADFSSTPLWILTSLPIVAMALMWRSSVAAAGISLFVIGTTGLVLFAPLGIQRPDTLDRVLRVVLQMGYLWLTVLLLLPLLDAVEQHRVTRRAELARTTRQHLRLEAILSAISTAVLVVDAAGWIRRANRAAEDLTGRSAQQLEGILVDAVVHLDWDAEDHDAREKTGRSEIPVKGGEPIPVAYRAMRLGDEEEYLVLLHDLRSAYAALADIESRSLALEEQGASRSRFVASVSHQLRAPLDALLDEATFLLEPDPTPLEGDQRRFAGIIRRNAEQFLELVDDMLLLSRLDADLLHPAREEITVLRLLRDAGIPRSPELDTIGSTGRIPLVQVDRQWTDRIFEEILDPIPFVGGSERRIAQRVSGDRYYLAISSRRLEPGRDDEWVFGPHFPEHEGPSPLSSARLGLVIARRLAQRLGGDLRTEHAGDTSSFVLALPVSGYRDTGTG